MEPALKNFIMNLPQDPFTLYLLLFASSIIENLFPPIPGDTITIFGAFLVGKGTLSFPLVYIVTTLGSTAGFMSLYFLGYFLEREFFMKMDLKIFSAKNIVSTEKWFEKYGYYVVLGNRFIPGLRSVVSIAAGIATLKKEKVFIFSLASAATWNLIWISAGYTLGNNWEYVQERFSIIIGSYNIAAVLLLSGSVFVYFLLKKIRNGKII